MWGLIGSRWRGGKGGGGKFEMRRGLLWVVVFYCWEVFIGVLELEVLGINIMIVSLF